jgi:hypothetical protein
MKSKRIQKPASKRRYFTTEEEQSFLSEKNRRSGYYVGFSKEEVEEEHLFKIENPGMVKVLQRLHQLGKREVVPGLLENVKRHRMQNGRVPTGNQIGAWLKVLDRFLQNREVTTNFLETLLDIKMVEEKSSEHQGGDSGDEWAEGGGEGEDGEWADADGEGGDGKWADADGEWTAADGDGRNKASPKFSSMKRGRSKREAKGSVSKSSVFQKRGKKAQQSQYSVVERGDGETQSSVSKSSVSRKRGKKAQQGQYSVVERGDGETQRRQCLWGKVVLKGSKRTLFSSNENIVMPEGAAPSSARSRKWKKRKT